MAGEISHFYECIAISAGKQSSHLVLEFACHREYETTKILPRRLFEDAGDYVIVLGVGDCGAVEGHYKGHKGWSSASRRMTRFQRVMAEVMTAADGQTADPPASRKDDN
jgi:hypothetical protein